MNPEEHRWLREQIGALALGQLSPDEAVRLQSHLDGCASCRADLDELAPLAEELRRVDVAALSVAATPSPLLGARIVEAVRREKPLSDRRSRRRTGVTAASVAAAAALLLGLGALADQELREPRIVVAAVPAVPMEQVSLLSAVTGVQVTRSIVIPHSWGIELQMAATGLTDGALYRGEVIGTDGRARPAGEFLGVAGKTVKCNLQAALLRKNTRSVRILDASGAVVMSAQLA